MNLNASSACTAFAGHTQLTAGALQGVALAVREYHLAHPDAQVLVFDDASGQQVELDLRGTPHDVVQRLHERFAPANDAPLAPPEAASDAPRGRGRPRLGVVAREVTLLPQHWEWLSAQPGGASVALRKLVHEARRAGGDARLRRRAAQEACYRFIAAMAGNLPGLEEAERALFAGQPEKFQSLVAAWPADVAAHAWKLAQPALATEATA